METDAQVTTRTKSIVPIAVSSALLAALVAGGSVYAYQKSQNEKAHTDFQSQISTLQQQVNMAKTSMATTTPLPTPDSVASITPIATVVPTSTPVPSLTSTQLVNFTYTDLNGKSHTLKNGAATYSPLGGGQGTISVLQDVGIQTVDLNGDGVLDSVLILGENDGGTGYYYQLVAVLNNDGKPTLASEHLILGDRSIVKTLTVGNGKIVVNGLISGVGQASADSANQPKTETYKLVGGKLTLQ